MRARSAFKAPEIRSVAPKESGSAAAARTETTEAAEEGVSAISDRPEIENFAGGFSEDTPNWPDEAAESAFLAEQPIQTLPAKPAVAVESEGKVEDAAAPAPLPSLDTLVNRIPAPTREILEELFRARFVSVKKVSKRTLKK